MFGYACDDTDVLMPLPIVIAQRLAEKLTEVRKNGTMDNLRPDGKTQVTIEYDEDDRPVRVDTVVLSTQHSEETDLDKLEAEIKQNVIDPVLATFDLPSPTATGCWSTRPAASSSGGPMGDAGLTGRKIIVDTYGGMARHGGGAFSGKDPSKVDRSAAYAMRWVAKNVVAAGLARRCEVAGRLRDRQGAARRCLRRRPSAPAPSRTRRSRRPCSRSSTCARPRSSATSTCCARSTPRRRRTATSAASCPEFTWERTDRAEALKAAVAG